MATGSDEVDEGERTRRVDGVRPPALAGALAPGLPPPPPPMANAAEAFMLNVNSTGLGDVKPKWRSDAVGGVM